MVDDSLVINIFNLIAEKLSSFKVRHRPHAVFTKRLCHVILNYRHLLSQSEYSRKLCSEKQIDFFATTWSDISFKILKWINFFPVYDFINTHSRAPVNFQVREFKKRTIKHNFHFLCNRLVFCFGLFVRCCVSLLLLAASASTFYQYKHTQAMHERPKIGARERGEVCAQDCIKCSHFSIHFCISNTNNLSVWYRVFFNRQLFLYNVSISPTNFRT